MRTVPLTADELGVCERLRFARSWLGLTQDLCAAQIGVNRATFANVESGRSPLRVDVALRFCRQFVFSEEWLATGRADASSSGRLQSPERDPELMKILRRQCMDLLSEPVCSKAPTGALFRDAYVNTFAERYAQLAAVYSFIPRVVFTAEDNSTLLFNYLSALNERWLLLASNEARRVGAAPVSWQQAFVRELVRCGGGILKKLVDGEEKDLPGGTLKSNTSPVNSELESLLERLRKATSRTGSKVELARYLGVARQRVTEWLSGTKEPGGETTLRLLRWVQEQERRKT